VITEELPGAEPFYWVRTSPGEHQRAMRHCDISMMNAQKKTWQTT
jgi:hypothetical protein